MANKEMGKSTEVIKPAKSEEKKTPSAADIKPKEVGEKVQAAIMQDESVQQAVGGLKKIKDISQEKIEPVIQNDILPAMSTMTQKLEDTMKEISKAVANKASEAGSIITKKQRSGNGDPYSIGDQAIEILNVGILGLTQ